jgi:Tol biopolymer transport system component
MLPDGKRFVFMADATSDEGHRIRLGSLDGGPTTILRSGVSSQPVVDPAGFMLLGERGQLRAYGFDLESGSLSDESTLVATQVYPFGNRHQLPAAVSLRGTLAYQNTSAASGLVFVDDAGRTMRTVGLPDRYANVSVSPDQKRLAFEIYTDTTERLVWVEDLERGVRTPISPRGAQSDSSAWSPDGTTVYFDSDASGTWEAYRKAIIGGGDPENLGVPAGAIEGVQDVSPDGRWLLVASGSRSGGRDDLFLRSIDGSGDAWTGWATGPADEASGTFSPDSRWIAYSSDASGRAEVYVSPLEGGPSAGRWQISSGGGVEPRFSPDGRTIYYRSPTFDWMAVDVRMTGQAVEAGAPRVLFPMPVIELPYLRNVMDVLPDGSGFVTIHPASSDVLSIRVRTGR